MKIEIVALSVLFLAACGNGGALTLQEAAPSAIALDGTAEDGGVSLVVTLTYPSKSGCPGLDDVTATLDGVALQQTSLGGSTALNGTGKTECSEQGVWETTAPLSGPGAGKLVFSDSSGSLTLDLPTLRADRAPRLTHTTVGPNGTVAITWPVADDTVSVQVAELIDSAQQTTTVTSPAVTANALNLTLPSNAAAGAAQAIVTSDHVLTTGACPVGSCKATVVRNFDALPFDVAFP